jgi:hypothetical protein
MKTKTKTATQLDTLKTFNGDARLYKLSEPIGYDWDCDTDDYKSKTDYVVVSAANVLLDGPETFIFPADESGEVVHWGELGGSFRGGLDHERALNDAGYTVES